MPRSSRASRFSRRIVVALLIAYTAFVCVITMTPRAPGSGTVIRWVNRALEFVHDRGLFLWADFLTIEFIGNILMFVPLGFFAALLLPRRAWWLLLVLGTAFSAVIEATQLLFLPERFPEVRDLVSNTTGFLVGAGVAVLIRLLVARRDRLVIADHHDEQRSRAEGVGSR